MSLGSNIKYYRVNKGLSHDDLARLMGVTKTDVLNWESGFDKPDDNTLRRLSKTLDVSISDLDPMREFDQYKETSNYKESPDYKNPSQETYSQSYDYQTGSVFSNIIHQDEEILWEGKPNPNKTFSSGDLFLIPFGLFFLGFAIFWTIMASAMGGFFGIFGLPFIAVGLYLVFFRFGHMKRIKSNTYYAVTNKRILRFVNLRRQIINEIRLSDIKNLNFNMNQAGNGTITFTNPNNNYYSYYHHHHHHYQYNYGYNTNYFNAFNEIDDARRVYDLISDLIEKINQPNEKN